MRLIFLFKVWFLDDITVKQGHIKVIEGES